MGRAWKWALIGLVAVAVATFAFAVWPTQWKYFQVEGATLVLQMRTNRFSEETQVLTPAGWVASSRYLADELTSPVLDETSIEPVTSDSGPVELPIAKLNSVEIRNNSWTRSSTIGSVDVYNGTSTDVKAVHLEVTFRSGAKRTYRISDHFPSKQSETTHVNFGIPRSEAIDWRVISSEYDVSLPESTIPLPWQQEGN